MEQDPFPSSHEIGHARQLLFSPGRAEVVTIRSRPSEGGAQEGSGPRKPVPYPRRSEEVQGKSVLEIRVLLRQIHPSEEL